MAVGQLLAMVKLSTRLKYRQLHRCKANYESRTGKRGQTPQCNSAAYRAAGRPRLCN